MFAIIEPAMAALRRVEQMHQPRRRVIGQLGLAGALADRFEAGCARQLQRRHRLAVQQQGFLATMGAHGEKGQRVGTLAGGERAARVLLGMFEQVIDRAHQSRGGAEVGVQCPGG